MESQKNDMKSVLNRGLMVSEKGSVQMTTNQVRLILNKDLAIALSFEGVETGTRLHAILDKKRKIIHVGYGSLQELNDFVSWVFENEAKAANNEYVKKSDILPTVEKLQAEVEKLGRDYDTMKKKEQGGK
ncbi:MAG: hypothetical protein WC488_05185 [Candidatus Micrarchaeia archaeon]